MKLFSLVSLLLSLVVAQAHASQNTTASAAPSRCYFGERDGSLVYVQNELGERRYRHESRPGLDLLSSAVETGFCTLDAQTNCEAKERETNLSAECTPQRDSRITLFVDGIIVYMESSKSVCNWPAGPKEMGKDNFKDLATAARQKLEKLCKVVSR